MLSVLSLAHQVKLKRIKYACAQWISKFSYYRVWLKKINVLSFPGQFGTIATVCCAF